MDDQEIKRLTNPPDQVLREVRMEKDILDKEYLEWQDTQPSSFVEAGETTEPLKNDSYNKRIDCLNDIEQKADKLLNTITGLIATNEPIGYNEVLAECSFLMTNLNEYKLNEKKIKL